MAKEEKTTKTEASDRQKRWEELLEAYEKRNPAKFASKKARGEFDKIPESFV